MNGSTGRRAPAAAAACPSMTGADTSEARAIDALRWATTSLLVATVRHRVDDLVAVQEEHVVALGDDTLLGQPLRRTRV